MRKLRGRTANRQLKRFFILSPSLHPYDMPTPSDFVVKALTKLSHSPQIKAFMWRRWYEDLARKYGQSDWTTMNYGFYDESTPDLPLEDAEQPARPSLALYHRVSRDLDLEGKKVVEIGSGRGGGAAYIARSRSPKLMIGLDFSDQATQLAQKLHDAPRLRFRQGDALALPLESDSFDAAINVESSHCYASTPQFLSEVARVLRVGGGFGWCDMRPPGEWNELRDQFTEAGLEIEDDTDITKNVLRALDAAAPAKEKIVMARVPQWMHSAFADFAGMPGSKVYNGLQNGEIRYGAIRARKQA